MRALALLSLCLPTLAFAQDVTPPTDGTISINAGAATTTNTTVTLSLSANDDTGVSQMCISGASSCSTWVSYATTYNWYLGSSPQGTRTVYVRYRDAAGNTSDQVSDTIVLDTNPPTGGTVSAAMAGSGELAVSWSGQSDAISGIASYKLVYSTTSSPNGRCTNGTVAYTGADTSVTLTGLSNGATHYLRLCAIDAAGNVATGVVTTGMPKAEVNPPSGTVVINSDALYTKTATVTLTLAATDDAGVTQMCISNSSACSSYQAYTTTKSWTLGATGLRTVYVYYKDSSGNISAAATDTITYDNVKPTDGSATITAGDASADIAWSGYTDNMSGIAAYKVVMGYVSTCNGGTQVYYGSDAGTTITGLTNGSLYYFRVCGVDGAGNVSSGILMSATPAGETDPPANATVTIDSGAAWTNGSSVSLDLYAEDVSGVEEMCISNTSTCSTWIPYVLSRAWSLAGSGESRTVYAWFKDGNGNISATPASDTIGFDNVLPTDGTVTGTSASTSITLNWSGFADATSGVASYRVVFAQAGVAPSNCGIGTVAYVGTNTTMTVSGLNDGVNHSFRVCAVDAAGNSSNGATLTIATVADSTAPTGTISLNSGDAWASAATVTVSLSASDDLSEITEVCLGESAALCSSYVAYSTTSTWTFSAGEGTRTLYARFRDAAGNTSVAASDSIGLDLSAPTDGSVSASWASAGSVALSWSGFSDTGSGISSYRIAAGADCSSALATATGTSATVSATSGALRVCAVDAAGNVSAGATVAVPDEVCGNDVDDNLDDQGCRWSGSFTGADITWTGAALSLAGAGDTDGDGLGDVWIGGNNTATLLTDLLSGGATFTGSAGEQLGAAVAAAGDHDGDGLADLLLGAPGAGGGAGQVYLITDPGAGLGGATLLVGGAGLVAAGSAVAAGDVDGDASPDVAVGVTGGVALLMGPLSGTVGLASADATLSGTSGGVALADLDGDGVADLLAGTSGGAALVYGPLAGTLSADVSWAGPGASVAGAGDVDGDGYGDVLLGGGGTSWLMYGPPVSGSSADVVFSGYSVVAGPGDLDGDGRDEVWLGGSGGAGLWYGPVAGSSPDASWTGAVSAVAGAGDVDGNSAPELLFATSTSVGLVLDSWY